MRLKDYKEYHTDTTVHFIITITEKGKEAIKKDGLEKAFKVVNSINTSNMVCFDPEGKIKKYATAEEILLDFYDARMDHYHRRKVRRLALRFDFPSLIHDLNRHSWSTNSLLHTTDSRTKLDSFK